MKSLFSFVVILHSTKIGVNNYSDFDQENCNNYNCPHPGKLNIYLAENLGWRNQPMFARVIDMGVGRGLRGQRLLLQLWGRWSSAVPNFVNVTSSIMDYFHVEFTRIRLSAFL